MAEPDKEDVIQKIEELEEEKRQIESKLESLEMRIHKLRKLENNTKFSFEKEEEEEDKVEEEESVIGNIENNRELEGYLK